MTISFFVHGLPMPGGSKKGFVTKTGRVAIVDAAENKTWRGDVKRAALEAYHDDPLGCPLEVTFIFFTLRPKGHYGEGRNAKRLKPSAPLYPASKPDALKLARSTEDALTGIIWKDDCLTVDLKIAKRYGPRPGCQIIIQVKESPK